LVVVDDVNRIEQKQMTKAQSQYLHRGLPVCLVLFMMKGVVVLFALLLGVAQATDPCDCTPDGCPSPRPKGCGAPKNVLWLPLGDSIT
jgi:hypothetical protein